MANVLESVMKLTDEYTATMQKIINSADNYEKKQKEAESAAKSFQTSVKNIGSSAKSASSGIDTLVLKIGGIVSAAAIARKAATGLFDVIKKGAQQQIQQNTFQSLMGNKQLGTDIYNYTAAYARNSAMSRGDLESATTSFLAYTKKPEQLKQLLDLTQRLYMWKPDQGGEGAVFALKEILAGQTMSLKNRFNINGISAEKVTDLYNKNDTTGIIKYLDQMMNKAGATQGVVDANFKSLSVQAANFGSNFTDAMGNQAMPAVQSLTNTLIDLNSEMKAGNFDGFFNAVAGAANNCALAGAWLAQNWQTVVPAIGAVLGAFTIYTMAAKTIKFVTETLDITISAATGNWIKLGLAIAGAVGGGILANKLIGDSGGDASTKQMQSYQDALKKLQEDQKKYGASTKGNAASYTVPTTVKNKDPIKVSGTVEIEKENLKYMFDAATAKFFATFNATKVEPSVTIQHQEVTEKADVQEINHELARMVTEAAGVTGGGSY